jgi:phosphatidylglycerol:prolipoprotein diacylglycerol transferase
MAPVLFRIGTTVIDTYTVVWALVLALALAWTRNRAGRLYGLDDEDTRVILFWGFLGILLGARLGNILVEWPTYAAYPEKLLRPWEGGLSALPAILGGGLTAWVVLRKRKIPAWPLAEAASLPAAALVAVGRWGCLAQGCCYGKAAGVPWAVRFPFDPAGITRHPTQLYESFSALLLLALLSLVERSFRRGGKRPQAAVLWPLFLAGYGGIRLVVDRFRGDVDLGSPRALAWSLGVFLLGAAWLSVTVLRPSKPAETKEEEK